MNKLQIFVRVICVATVLLSNGISVNAFFRLHPNFADHEFGIFNGDDDSLTKETIVRAEKWSKFHGSNSKFDRFHGMQGTESCQPLKRGANRMVECQNQGRFPVKNECRGFLMCLRKGDTPVPSCCPYGLYFDHIQRSCIEKTDAQCFNVCQEIGAKFVDPKDPRKYFECSSLGIPESVSCPQAKPDKDGVPDLDNLIFDSKSQQCKSHETIDAEIDNLMGKKFDDAFQKTFGVPAFQTFNEDDFFQTTPVSSPTEKPTTKLPSSTFTPSQTASSTPPPLSPPALSPLVGFGPQPAKYEQLLDMAGDDSSDSEDSVENTDNDKSTSNEGPLL